MRSPRRKTALKMASWYESDAMIPARKLAKGDVVRYFGWDVTIDEVKRGNHVGLRCRGPAGSGGFRVGFNLSVKGTDLVRMVRFAGEKDGSRPGSPGFEIKRKDQS